MKIVSLSAADSATAFAAGKVDAAATYEPFLTFNASNPLYLQKSFESAVQILHDTGKISTGVDAASLIDDSLIKSL